MLRSGSNNQQFRMAHDSTEFRSRFGRAVREFRGRRGLSQERLGERAGLSYKFIGEIERGVGNPTLHSVLSIARALDVEAVTLLGGGESTEDASYTFKRADFDTAREALESLNGFLQRLDQPSPPRRKGRRSRKAR